MTRDSSSDGRRGLRWARAPCLASACWARCQRSLSKIFIIVSVVCRPRRPLTHGLSLSVAFNSRRDDPRRTIFTTIVRSSGKARGEADGIAVRVVQRSPRRDHRAAGTGRSGAFGSACDLRGHGEAEEDDGDEEELEALKAQVATKVAQESRVRGGGEIAAHLPKAGKVGVIL